MRYPLESVVVSENNKKSDLLLELYLELESDLAFFTARLAKLQIIFASSPQLKRREVYDEAQIVSKLIETTQAYIETLKTTTTFGFKKNKMDDKDVTVLKAQVRGVKALREFIEPPQKIETTLAASAAPVCSDKLSQLIHDVPKMEYSISTTRRWLRRGAFILGSIISATVAVIAVAALMTPGVNLIAATVMVPTVLAAAGAFLYMRHPVTTSSAVNIGPFHTSVSAAVPSSLGAVAAAGMGVSLFSKLRITNPVREAAARNTQAATMNGYIEELKKKINAAFTDFLQHTAKSFLLLIVDKASRLYNEGMNSWFVETRTSKTTKARLMLSEVAKILERADLQRLSVDNMLAMKVGNSNETFEVLLNSKRNLFGLWQTKSDTMKTLRDHGVILERNPDSLSSSLIAKMINQN